MKSILVPLLLLLSTTYAWRFVSKVEELPVEETDRLEINRPKVRLCGGDSAEDSSDCVLCTVCHPHEYELIGCSGRMDSICASCTTGWMRSTPKTVDFFRKCKKHPQLPFLFPDVQYGYKRNVDKTPVKSSMFADQEKMLQEAEKTESTEMFDDELSEEYDDTEDGEDDDEEEVRDEVPADWKKEKTAEDPGFNSVMVDERDEDSASGEVEKSAEDNTEYEFKFHTDLEQMIAAEFEKMGREKKEDVNNESLEEEDSMEAAAVKEEERADPFDAKTEKMDEEEEEAERSEEESVEELQHRVYPLHKVNIWRIIGPEKMKIDDKDISDDVRKAINDRADEWRMAKGLSKQRIHLSSAEIVDDYTDNRQRVIAGYRPQPHKYAPRVLYLTEMMPMERIAWAFCLFLLFTIVAATFKICLRRRRNRVMVLPELDEMSRQLINEAHARIHAKQEKQAWPKPQFV